MKRERNGVGNIGTVLRTLAVMTLLVVTTMVMAMPAVSASYTTRYSINTGQEISFNVHGSDSETVEIIYYPHQVGNRKFEA